MIRWAAVLHLLLAPCVAFAAWTPPANPDPMAIVQEAMNDRIAGRYEDALAKHVWIHREALKHQPSMSGVRVTFALSDWARLASRYPPAMTALRAERDAARKSFEAGPFLLEPFVDMASIDRVLEEPAHTHRMFLILESRDAAVARRAFYSAREALIEQKDYAACARHLEPDRDLARALETYQEMSKPRPGFQFVGASHNARRLLAQKMGENVAILVLAGRVDEARALAAKLLEVESHPDVRNVVDRALEGQLPPPILSAAEKALLKAVMP